MASCRVAAYSLTWYASTRTSPSSTPSSVKTTPITCTARPPRPAARVVPQPTSNPPPTATSQNIRWVPIVTAAQPTAVTSASTAATMMASGRFAGWSSYCAMARLTSCCSRSMHAGHTRSMTSLTRMGVLPDVLPHSRHTAAGGVAASFTAVTSASSSVTIVADGIDRNQVR